MTGSRIPPGAPSASSPGRAFRLWTPVALYCAGIYMLSSVSDVPDLPVAISDKAGHLLLYSGLGFLITRAVSGGLGRAVPGWIVCLAVAASVLYGLTDEAHQFFVPQRQFDLRDLAADGLGAALGAGGVWLWGIIAPTRDTPPRPDP